MWEIGYPIASSKLKRKVMIASYITTPSPASCVKVDHSLLFSICFCHLTSKIVIHIRKPSSYSTHLRFPSWSWDFCCRSNAWLGFILTFDRKIDLQGILPKNLQQISTQQAHLLGLAWAQLALHQAFSLPWTINHQN